MRNSPVKKKLGFPCREDFPEKLWEKIDELKCSSDTKEIIEEMILTSNGWKEEVAALVPLKIGLECFHNIYHLRPLLDALAPNFGFCVWAYSDTFAYIGLSTHPNCKYQDVIAHLQALQSRIDAGIDDPQTLTNARSMFFLTYATT